MRPWWSSGLRGDTFIIPIVCAWAWHAPPSTGATAVPLQKCPALFHAACGAPSPIGQPMGHMRAELPAPIIHDQESVARAGHTWRKDLTSPAFSKAAIWACPCAPGQDTWNFSGPHFSLGMATHFPSCPGDHSISFMSCPNQFLRTQWLKAERMY